MTIGEAEAALKAAGADTVTIAERDGDRASIRIEAGGRETGISVALPHGVNDAVARLKQWLRETV